MTNLEIIKSTYESATPAENAQNLAKYLAEDMIWIEAAGFPYAGAYKSLEAVQQNVFARLGADWINFRFEIEGYIDGNERIVAFGTYKGTYKATQKYCEARVVHLWTLQFGKITKFEQFVDSKTVADTLV